MTTTEQVNVGESGEQQDEQSLINLARAFKIPWKRKWLVLLAVALSTSAGFFYALKQPKIYQARCSIQIEPRAPNVLGRRENNEVVDIGAGAFWSNREYFETQYRILESRDLAEVVAKRLNLQKDPRFWHQAVGTQADRSILEAAQSLQHMLKVEPIKDTRLVWLYIKHTDPEVAELLANTIAQAYIDRNLERAMGSTEGALGWLNEQLNKLRDTVTTSEQKLYEFKKDRNVLSLSLEDRQNLTSSELTQISALLVKTKTERMELEAQKSAMADALKLTLQADLGWTKRSGDLVLQGLKSQYSKDAVDLSSLQAKYGPSHPSVRSLEAQSKGVLEQIQAHVKSLMDGIETEYQAKVKSEKSLKTLLDSIHKQGVELSLMAIDYNKLAREKDQSTKLFDLVLARSKETDLARYLHFNNISLLDSALRPDGPISPKVGMIIAISALLGLIFGIAFAFLIEFLDFTVRSYEDAQRESNAPLLGVLAGRETFLARTKYSKYGSGGESDGLREALERNGFDLIAATHPHSIIAEAARSIRTNLLFMATDQGIRRVLVTSPGPSEGKTFVATTLAIILAQSGKRVLICDTDLRRPRLHKIFPGQGARGVTDVLAGQCVAADVVEQTTIPNLAVALAGPIPPNPAELLHSTRFADLLNQLNEMFDVVILDSPPLGAVTDAAILSRVVDGTILVARHGRTHKASLRHGSRQLRRLGSRIFGVILNDADFSRGSYYRYDYYRTYGYSYRADEPTVAAN